MQTGAKKSQREPECNTKDSGPKNNQIYCFEFTLKACEPVLEEAQKFSHVLNEYCKQWYFQIEKGNETNYVHYQGCASLRTKHRLSEIKNLLGRMDVHIEPAKNWSALVNYCQKEETRLYGPWSHQKPFLKTIALDRFKEWQSFFYNILIRPCTDDRTIYWIYDLKGNTGKTSFAKYMCVNHNAVYLNNGKKADIAYSLPPDPKIVIFDFARSIEKHINYEAIECVKNGILFSGKYESKTLMFDSPHIICLANWVPNFDSMSKDRWNIYELNEDGILLQQTIETMASRDAALVDSLFL